MKRTSLQRDGNGTHVRVCVLGHARIQTHINIGQVVGSATFLSQAVRS